MSCFFFSMLDVTLQNVYCQITSNLLAGIIQLLLYFTPKNWLELLEYNKKKAIFNMLYVAVLYWHIVKIKCCSTFNSVRRAVRF